MEALHDLITLRNELLHISEEPLTLYDGKEHVVENVPIEGNETLIEVRVRVPRLVSRWAAVTLQSVLKYQEAVRLYFEEVLNPVLGCMREGEIIITLRHRRRAVCRGTES